MSTESAVRVMPAGESLQTTLLRLSVSTEQQAYVGRIADLLADVARCPEADSMAICLGDEVIGYYRIDPHARSVAGRDFELPALGLRGFFIDARWQGRGLGPRALVALLRDLRARHAGARLLALNVNQSNQAAARMYQRAGFRRSGKLYHGGRAGPQHLMLRALP